MNSRDYIKVGKTDKLFKRPFALFLISLLMVLITAFGTFYLIDNANIGKSNFKKNNSVVSIYSAAEFVDAIKTNSIIGDYEKRFILYEDIVLSQDDIADIRNTKNVSGEYGVWFYGSFDGKGHTITIDGTLDAPLFEQLKKGSTFKQVCFSGIDLQGTDDIGIAIISKVNHGTIENISVVGLTVTVGQASSAAALVIYNYGTIQHCAIEASYIIDNAFISDGNVIDLKLIWNHTIGTIAATNCTGGVIDSVFISAGFPVGFSVLTLDRYNKNGDKNQSVGYAVGSWGSKSIIKNVWIVDGSKDIRAYDLNEIKDGEITFISSDSIVSANYASWDSYGWVFSKDGELPTLKRLY